MKTYRLLWLSLIYNGKISITDDGEQRWNRVYHGPWDGASGAGSWSRKSNTHAFVRYSRHRAHVISLAYYTRWYRRISHVNSEVMGRLWKSRFLGETMKDHENFRSLEKEWKDDNLSFFYFWSCLCLCFSNTVIDLYGLWGSYHTVVCWKRRLIASGWKLPPKHVMTFGKSGFPQDN